MQEDLRTQLIKQFPSEVIEITEEDGKQYYVCPACTRAVGRQDPKCLSCSQALSWDNIRHYEEKEVGISTATLTFEVPGDFTPGNCRKCPLSYIAKVNDENVYECPLKMRSGCKLKLSAEV